MMKLIGFPNNHPEVLFINVKYFSSNANQRKKVSIFNGARISSAIISYGLLFFDEELYCYVESGGGALIVVIQVAIEADVIRREKTVAPLVDRLH